MINILLTGNVPVKTRRFLRLIDRQKFAKLDTHTVITHLRGTQCPLKRYHYFPYLISFLLFFPLLPVPPGAMCKQQQQSRTQVWIIADSDCTATASVHVFIRTCMSI